MKVKIEITRDDGTVILTGMASAFDRFEWIAPHRSSIIRNGIALDGFVYHPYLRSVTEEPPPRSLKSDPASEPVNQPKDTSERTTS